MRDTVGARTRTIRTGVGRRRVQIVKGIDIHSLRERLRLDEHPRFLSDVILPLAMSAKSER